MRYAIYYTPEPGGLFHQLGERWLARPDALLDDPRRYGFHATLKAPFRLRPGIPEREIIRHVARLADDLNAVNLGHLRLSWSEGYLSLRPSCWHQSAQEIANECVVALDHLRAPLTGEELARRRRANLTARQETYLASFGYPFVFAEFRFHMTLSGPAPAARLEALAAEAEACFAVPLSQPHRLDALALMREAVPGGKLALVDRFNLRSGGGIWPELWKWSVA